MGTSNAPRETVGVCVVQAMDVALQLRRCAEALRGTQRELNHAMGHVSPNAEDYTHLSALALAVTRSQVAAANLSHFLSPVRLLDLIEFAGVNSAGHEEVAAIIAAASEAPAQKRSTP